MANLFRRCTKYHTLQSHKTTLDVWLFFSVEVLCNAFELSELPTNLSPMSVRMSKWTRNMWKGKAYVNMKAAQQGLQNVLGNTGVLVYEEIIQAELEIRSIDGCLTNQR